MKIKSNGGCMVEVTFIKIRQMDTLLLLPAVDTYT